MSRIKVRTYVNCPTCKTKFYEGEVVATNIEEGERGEDIITFECPNCKIEIKSVVRG